ncbi:hypothetical protein [Glaciimonas soli]|uniref:Uncharacterized protein n=1 Tax=Glaciimonas soli TaxID=2590999 RepID=A0A843YXB5_9BURK|nr:hypothetical protein [Glaciimonas soli]MQR02314.1 hypothetical protein [Glaciimonas soli]
MNKIRVKLESKITAYFGKMHEKNMEKLLQNTRKGSDKSAEKLADSFINTYTALSIAGGLSAFSLAPLAAKYLRAHRELSLHDLSTQLCEFRSIMFFIGALAVIMLGFFVVLNIRDRAFAIYDDLENKKKNEAKAIKRRLSKRPGTSRPV